MTIERAPPGSPTSCPNKDNFDSDIDIRAIAALLPIPVYFDNTPKMSTKPLYVSVEDDPITKTSTEKLTSKARVNPTNIGSIALRGAEFKDIKSSPEDRTKFKLDNKKVWLCDINVQYSDNSTSKHILAHDVIVDPKYSPKDLSFFNVGIPEFIVKKIIADVATPRGIRVAAPIENGYHWVKCKTASFDTVTAVGGIDETMQGVDILTRLKERDLATIGIGMMALKLKCTCPDTIDAAGVASQTWGIGATLQSFMITSTPTVRSPASISLGGGKLAGDFGMTKADRDMKLPDVLMGLLSGMSTKPSYEGM